MNGSKVYVHDILDLVRKDLEEYSEEVGTVHVQLDPMQDDNGRLIGLNLVVIIVRNEECTT